VRRRRVSCHLGCVNLMRPLSLSSVRTQGVKTPRPTHNSDAASSASVPPRSGIRAGPGLINVQTNQQGLTFD
jgi:hypothetical protein